MNNKDWKQIMRALALLTQVGLLIIVSAGIGFGIGYWLDRLLSFNLLFEIIGLLIGLVSGFYAVYNLLMSTFDEDDK
ncbi:MAG: AtpZ/AtpI family protein [Halanaerobium sp.]